MDTFTLGAEGKDKKKNSTTTNKDYIHNKIRKRMVSGNSVFLGDPKTTTPVPPVRKGFKARRFRSLLLPTLFVTRPWVGTDPNVTTTSPTTADDKQKWQRARERDY